MDDCCVGGWGLVAEDECARALPSDDSFADPDMGFCIEMTGGCADWVPDVRIVGLVSGVSGVSGVLPGRSIHSFRSRATQESIRVSDIS